MSELKTVDPDLVDMLREFKRSIAASLHFAEIGEIQSFDATKKTAEVKVMLKRHNEDGTTLDWPLLLDCPVVVWQGGGVSLQMPVSKGDHCLVVFADRDIDAWFKSGTQSVPFSGRTHDASDGIAIVGLCSLASSLPAISATDAGLVTSDASATVKKDGSAASLKQGGIQITAKGNKAVIKNASTDLLTALNGLIDVVKTITVVDPISGTLPMTPTIAAQLESYKATFAGLLASS